MSAYWIPEAPEGYKIEKMRYGRRPVSNLRYVAFTFDQNLSPDALKTLCGYFNVEIYPGGDHGKDCVRIFAIPETDIDEEREFHFARRNRVYAKRKFDELGRLDCSSALYPFTKGLFTDEDAEREYPEQIKRNKEGK